MRQRVVLLVVSLVLAGLSGGSASAQASPPNERRWSVALLGGLFVDRSDLAGALLRKDGEPGNPIVGWQGTANLELAAGYEVTKAVVLELAVGRAGFDTGADYPTADFTGMLSDQIATGTLTSVRLTAWFHLDESFTFAQDSPHWGRWMVGLTTGCLTAGSVAMSPEGVDAFGVVSVDGGTESLLGFGVRAELRLGRSGWALGLESLFMWSFGGPILDVRTSAASPYSSTDVSFLPYTITALIGYHF